MSKLIGRLGSLALVWRPRAETVPESDWSPLFCKMIAINLVETTVKPSRRR